MNKLHVKFFQMLLFGLVALMLLPSQAMEAQIVASRNASNTESCNGNLQYGLYMNLVGPTDAFYEFQWSGFTEYADGTAELNGSFVNVNNSNLKFNVSATFSGRTFNAPIGSPKAHDCAPENSTDWYYYTSVSGNLMGVSGLWGANINISTPAPSNDVPAFQVGTGANITDQPGIFGASGWLDLELTSQANNAANAIYLESTPVGTEGDFNFRLSGQPLSPPTGPTCQNLTSGGQIGGAQMNCGGFNPAPLTNNVTPTGGAGAIEYLWLSSTTGCPTSPTGQGIANSNAPTYDPGYLAQTTYFLRCSRRDGCTAWVGESNCIAVIIDENCGSTCDNVTSGGSISGTQTNCGPFNPTTLTSSSSPSGGSGAIEYLWLSSTTGCPVSAITQGIPNSNSPTYNPSTISQTTYFLRCSRRAGCTAWVGESNCITLTVDNNCGGGGDEIDLELTFTSPQASVNAYQSFDGTITITNNSNTTATGVVVDIDKNGNVVQSGTVSQGSYSSWPSNVWTVGTLAPGESATFDGAFYSLENNPQIYAQVSAANEPDVDSTPGNGTCCSAGEDDEAVIEYGGTGGNTCQVTITANTMNVQCNDNGTPNNPNDDTYTFQVMANATAQGGVSLWGWFVEGNASVMYDYGQAVSFGPFPISGGNQTLTIIDQDNLTCELDVTAVAPAPCSTSNPMLPSISVSDVTVNEGAGDADVSICLSSASTQNVTFIASTGGGTATAGADYSNQSYAIFIPAGNTCATFSVPIIDDSTDEPNETVNVTLSGVGNATVADGTGVVTIIDNDVPSGNLIDLELTFTSPQSSVNAFTSFDGTITVTNNSNTTATGVVVDIDKNGNVVQSGTVSQGNFSTWPSEVWTVGTLAPGQSATLEGAFYSLQNNPQIYAQVSAANQTDVDSTPGNGACCSAGEDDEAVIQYGTGTPNGTPTANNDNAQSNGAPVNIFVTNNDSFGTDGPNNGQIVITNNPNNGSASVNNNGTPNDPTDDYIVYNPNNGFEGTDQVTYRITDSDGDTDTAVATIVVSQPNSTPTANNDSAQSNGAPVNVFVTNNDSFGADGPNNGQIVITNNPSNGSASVNTNGTPNDPTDDYIVYNPNNGFVGTDQITYRITDSNGDTDTAVATIVVSQPNSTPSANNDFATTNEGEAVMVMVTMNDSFGGDGPNNGQIVITSNPSNGSAFVNTNGTPNDPTDDKITYTPNSGFTGTDSFVYRITDSNGDTDTAVVSVTVTPNNNTPTAVDDTATTDSNTSVMVMVTMNDDFGADGPNNWQVVLTTNPTFGVAYVSTSGTTNDPTDDKIVYIPNAGFVGTDQLVYRIADADGDLSYATVTITVTAANGMPTAMNDQATTNSGQMVMTMVTMNDSFGSDGPNNGQIVIIGNPSNGTASVNNNGTPNDPTDDKIVYTSDNGFSGTDQVTYRITDSNGDTDTATLTITVNTPNGTPTAVNDQATTESGQMVMTMVTMNDSFGSDGPNNGQVVITGNPSNGTAYVSSNSTPNDPTDDKIVYTPDNGFVGTDQVTYRITDSNGDQDFATLTITVNMPNGNPDAVNDQANTTTGQSVMVMVLNNDDFGTDGPNNGSITITNNGNNGTATVNNNGTPNDPTDDTITYTPNAGFSGTDQVTYQITDSNGDTDTATITITVTQPNGNPNAITDNATVDEDGSVTIDVTGNDDFGTDGAANGMISIISSPANGTATVNGNGTATTADDTVTYTPNPGFTGQDSFVYQITDGNGDTSTATVNITVNAVGPNVCNTSTVTNASSGGCNTNNFNRGFYSDDLVSGLSGSNNDGYNVTNGVFTEFDDGTATFTGTFRMHDNGNARFNAVVNFSGKTFNGSAKTSSCVNSTADWYYYTNVTGTLTGTHHLAGGVLNITTLTGAPDDEFQVGTGANLFDANLFGASAWLSYNIVSQPNGSAHFNNGAQTDFNFVLSGSPTACGSNPNGGGNGSCADGKDVLFVVGSTNLNNGDEAAKDILEDLGFDVMVMAGDGISLSDANGKDLVVISSTVSSSDVGHTFETTSTPVVVWEAWLFDEMNIATNGDFGTQSGDEIHIFDENHPITDGFTGDVQVYTTNKNLTWGTPPSAGNDQAYIPGASNKCVIISYDTGDEMVNNFHAPGRRIGLFLHNDGAAYLTADGKTLVENAFLYAVNCPTSGSSNFTAPQADLITVTAKRDLNHVDVKWANNTGYKNAYFLVQHSLDGVSFETIAEVDNDSDDENLAFYTWTDENPAIGENYYRIQVMYRDAQGWNYSDNSKVMFSEIFDFQLFPNPATDYVDLNLEEIVGNEVTITIVNQLGQTIQVEQINEVTSLHRLQLQNIKYDGQYIVWITTDGRKPIAKSLMVMKN